MFNNLHLYIRICLSFAKFTLHLLFYFYLAGNNVSSIPVANITILNSINEDKDGKATKIAPINNNKYKKKHF